MAERQKPFVLIHKKGSLQSEVSEAAGTQKVTKKPAVLARHNITLQEDEDAHLVRDPKTYWHNLVTMPSTPGERKRLEASWPKVEEE